ncbi:MAG TPA: NAD-dependent protein deacylase [Actinomycetota bacterium]
MATEASTIERVATAVASAERIVVLTGAGISTESGIPDFRGPSGVWTKDPQAMRRSNIEEYLRDPELRAQVWRDRMHHPAWGAEPNAGHRALVELERTGRLLALITQNIDGLHQAAGSTDVLELHGTIHLAKCLSCDRRTPMQEQLDRVRAGEPDPACTECGGIQKAATVSFGEHLDPAVLDAAFAASSAADLFLAVGTSLMVQPASLLAVDAERAGAELVIVNQGETPLDDRADAVLRSPIGEVLPAIAKAG